MFAHLFSCARVHRLFSCARVHRLFMRRELVLEIATRVGSLVLEKTCNEKLVLENNRVGSLVKKMRLWANASDVCVSSYLLLVREVHNRLPDRPACPGDLHSRIHS